MCLAWNSLSFLQRQKLRILVATLIDSRPSLYLSLSYYPLGNLCMICKGGISLQELGKNSVLPLDPPFELSEWGCFCIDWVLMPWIPGEVRDEGGKQHRVRSRTVQFPMCLLCTWEKSRIYFARWDRDMAFLRETVHKEEAPGLWWWLSHTKDKMVLEHWSGLLLHTNTKLYLNWILLICKTKPPST